MTEKVVVVLSGGLDSTTLLYEIIARGYEAHAISFNYGQRHAKELECAKEICSDLGVDHRVVDLTSLAPLFAESGSSLVTGNDVPEGHYGEESMKATVVPNRNMIMFSIATGFAVSIEAEQVAMGMHAGDHFIYPDCRPEFVNAAEHAAREGNMGFLQGPYQNNFAFTTPFLFLSKNDIASAAVRLGVPIAMTWSCYKGGEIHCGKCGTCVERREALESVLYYPEVELDSESDEEVIEAPAWEDPTEYEDRDYYLTALKRETV